MLFRYLVASPFSVVFAVWVMATFTCFSPHQNLTTWSVSKPTLRKMEILGKVILIVGFKF
ncbi:hypothetical protein HOY82DRAFT_668163 [Tuber indicum]|nr:hypothetical protein HOY82DRAFT_668163 [Tuber indicum]